jgi:MinD superfamily P-loop ATPase
MMAIRELVIASGKGGTGKTSVSASFAVLAREAVLADCDVDAPDLHLLLAPQLITREDFYSGNQAVIRREACTACGRCAPLCRFGAISSAGAADGRVVYRIDPAACEGCGVCVRFCPALAIDFPERLCGVWMVSATRAGKMVHARLGAAAENSGKLVSTVRREARRIAGAEGRQLILVDGPPGIGCPVIASLTGADAVLLVTEPTVSGEHDLARIMTLARHFSIPVSVTVNKWDIAPDVTKRIERSARESGARILGRIRYDRAVTEAQLAGNTAVENSCPAGDDIRALWQAFEKKE